MATKFWICYECKTKGTEEEFRHPEDGHECPKCKHCDASFPWRKFRCLGCGFSEEQGKFFGWKDEFGKDQEADLDADPTEEKMEYECSSFNNPLCDSKEYEQIDDSIEPPKQKLFELRQTRRDGIWLFEEELDQKYFMRTEIDADRCPLGTRFAAMEREYGRDYIVAEAKVVEFSPGKQVFYGDAVLLEDPFDVKDDKGRARVIKASQRLEEDYEPWFPLFVPRQDDWSSEQWLKHILKERKLKKR